LHRSCLLKHLVEVTVRKIEGKGNKDEDEDIRSSGMTLKEENAY
jgi:hypothetical protein